MLLAACGTASPHSPVPRRSDPLPTKAFQCQTSESRAQVCSELAQARLSTKAGVAALELVDCDVNGLGGVIRWVSTSAADQQNELQLLVRFDSERIDGRLTPISFRRFQTHWPCPECSESEEATISMPLADGCLRRGVGATIPVQVTDFAIQPVGPTNCPSGLGMNDRDGWCERPVEPGTERYDVESWWVATPMTQGTVVVAPNSIQWRARLTPKHPWRGGRIEDITQIVAIRDQLKGLWAMPPELSREGCRDGGLRLVAAQRANEWRVVRRVCSDPAGLSRLLQSWMGSPFALDEAQ